MIANIIGLGQTALNWDGTGFSLGCNDVWRFGKPTNHLLVINSLNNEPERKKIVENSCPEILWSQMLTWQNHPNYKSIGPMASWHHKFSPGMIYTSNNSPFVAVTLAYKLGYRKFILWGVDLMNHRHIRQDNDMLPKALEDFHFLQVELLKNKASMYLGCKGSALDLPIWK